MSKSEKNVSTKGAMGKILRYIHKYWFFVGVSVLLAALTVALTLYIPILIGDAVDLIVDKGLVDLPGIFDVMKKIGIVMVLTAIAQWVMNTCNNYITFHVIQDIRKDAFAKLEILPLKYIDARSYGDMNVKRIMEKLGGGGHRTVAACQIRAENYDVAQKLLINAIEEYKEEQLRG